MARKKEHYRPFIKALVYTRSGDMDLSWLLLLLMSLTAIIVVLWVIVIHPATAPIQIAALSFLGTAFIAVLIASVPIAKAKILASMSLDGDVRSEDME